MDVQLVVGRETIEILRYQRGQLQVNILDPLRQIKEKIGRSLQRKEVQIIKSFLTKEIQRDTLENASDGEALVRILDLYYGEDNLKFVGRLLSKASCQDLVGVLQEWMSNNKIINPNTFHNFGFFPLWIKVNYNFNEFSKNRLEIFNILKRVFGIPTLDNDTASDYTVYMGVSLGKRDVLVCVLVPYCVRQNIRTSLERDDITLQLRKAHITGIYFSRIKDKSRPIYWAHKNNLTGSDSSISSAMSSDFGDLCDPAYVETNGSQNTKRNDFHHSSNPRVHQLRSLIVQTGHEKIDLNGNYQDPKVLIPHNDSISMDSRGQANQGLSSVGIYGDDINTGPKLVRGNYGYLRASNRLESTNKAITESDKLSYGACIFVDQTSAPRTVYSRDHSTRPIASSEKAKTTLINRHSYHSEPSVQEDRASFLLTKDVAESYSVPHEDAKDLSRERNWARYSPRSDREEMLYSRKFDSDHEKELVASSREIIDPNSNEIDDDPSLWYQPKQMTDRLPNNRSRLSSVGAQRDSQEIKPNLPKKQGNSERDLGPSYWRENESRFSYHGDTLCYNDEYLSNHTNNFEYPRNYEDNQRRGCHGDYLDNETLNNHTNYPVSSNHRDDQRHGYHGNNPNDRGGCQFHRFMEAEPEPGLSSMTSRLSFEERNRQAAGVFERQSTPTSTFLQADQSVNLGSDQMSRSMPSLHAKQKDDMFDASRPRWSDSRHSNGYHGHRQHMSKYESEADLEDNVFVNTYNNSVKASPPPYCPPPDYQQTMVRKSCLSLSSVSLETKRVKARCPLLSSRSVSSIYKEKELLLNREELQESIRSAEEKQWEILLEKSKEFLIAVKMGDEEEVENLLEEDIDVDYKNEFGHTALMVASREGHLDVIQVLIAHGADMNIQDKYGKSALHEAAWSGHHQVIHALISNEAGVNCVDEEGRTPLQYASLRGKTKVAEVLLCFGADTSFLNKDGESAVEIAYRCRRKDIVKMLLKSTDKKTRKVMKGKIRKQRIQRITAATSLPNLTRATSLKTLTRSRSKPDVNKKGACVTQ